MKCFMHAAAGGKFGKAGSSSVCMPWTMALPISAATKGHSPKVSKLRDHKGWVLMPKMGANSQGMPAALVSLPWTRPMDQTRSRLNEAAALIC